MQAFFCSLTLLVDRHTFFLLQILLKNSTMWLCESGILRKLRDDELNAPTKLPQPKYKINQSLTMVDLSMAFVVQVFGLFLAIIAFMIEYLRKSGNGKLATSLSPTEDFARETKKQKQTIGMRQIHKKVSFLFISKKK